MIPQLHVHVHYINFLGLVVKNSGALQPEFLINKYWEGNTTELQKTETKDITLYYDQSC